MPREMQCPPHDETRDPRAQKRQAPAPVRKPAPVLSALLDDGSPPFSHRVNTLPRPPARCGPYGARVQSIRLRGRSILPCKTAAWPLLARVRRRARIRAARTIRCACHGRHGHSRGMSTPRRRNRLPSTRTAGAGARRRIGPACRTFMRLPPFGSGHPVIQTSVAVRGPSATRPPPSDPGRRQASTICDSPIHDPPETKKAPEDRGLRG